MPEQGRILIAEDDALFLWTTRTVLEKEGYTCTCATDMETVKAFMEQQEYDLLIVNVELSGMRQSEWMEILHERVKQVPTILTTGRPSLESALQAIQLQVGAYLVKPFEVRLLLTEVRKAIPRARVAKIARKIRDQWQDSYQDLQEISLDMCAATMPPEPAIEMLLTMVMENLSQCSTALQEIHAFFQNETGQTPSVPASLLNRQRQTGRNARLEDAVPPLVSPQRACEETRCADSLPVEILAHLEDLSRRERDVLRLLLENQRPKAIARTLFISLHTVRNHLRSIFEKFSVHSQTELLTLLGRYSTYPNLQETM